MNVPNAHASAALRHSTGTKVRTVADDAWPDAPARSALWKITLACAVVLVAFAAVVWHRDGSVPIEHALTTWLVGTVPDPPSLSLRELRHFPLYVLILPGEPLIFLASVVLLAKAAWEVGERRLAVVCGGGPALAVMLTDFVAKPLVDRHLREGIAYPSGHTTAATALAVATFVLLRRISGKRTAWTYAPVLALVPLATGFGVLALHWHVLFDIPGGLAMGTGVMLALTAIAFRRDRT